MGYFTDPSMLSTDPALIARGRTPKLDALYNNKLGIRSIFNAPALIVPDRPLAIVCAADSLMKPIKENGPRRIDALNQDQEKYAIVLAGAGHYALGEEKLDLPFGKYSNVSLWAISNFSVGNSHTKAFANARDDVNYLMASHCAAEELSGNISTIQHLINTLSNAADNVRLFDAMLDAESQGPNIIGTGTGAPPAAIAVMAVMRHRQGLGPVNAKLFGFDGTDKFFIPTEELPEEYQKRLQSDHIQVRMDGNIFVVQKTFFDQMKQIAFMATNYPDLVGKITVDNPNTLAARIFNTSGMPRTDFEIVTAPPADTPPPRLEM